MKTRILEDARLVETLESCWLFVCSLDSDWMCVLVCMIAIDCTNKIKYNRLFKGNFQKLNFYDWKYRLILKSKSPSKSSPVCLKFWYKLIIEDFILNKIYIFYSFTSQNRFVACLMLKQKVFFVLLWKNVNISDITIVSNHKKHNKVYY